MPSPNPSVVIGYSNGDGSAPVDPNYIISLAYIPAAAQVGANTVLTSAGGATSPVTVLAPWQEHISFRIGSEWRSLVPDMSNNVNIAALSQAAGFGNVASKIQTRRIWTGTSPVQLKLNLKFQAVSSSYQARYNEVQYPLMLLQQIAAPSMGTNVKVAGLSATVPLLRPPGPNPFAIPALQNFQAQSTGAKTIEELFGAGAALLASKYLGNNILVPAAAVGLAALVADTEPGDTITVSIGTQIVFSSVIVKDAEVKIEPKPDEFGLPTSASVDLTLESYEILTKQDLQQVYNPNPLVGPTQP